MGVSGRDLRIVDGPMTRSRPGRPPVIYPGCASGTPDEEYLRRALVAQGSTHWTVAAAMAPHGESARPTPRELSTASSRRPSRSMTTRRSTSGSSTPTRRLVRTWPPQAKARSSAMTARSSVLQRPGDDPGFSAPEQLGATEAWCCEARPGVRAEAPGVSRRSRTRRTRHGRNVTGMGPITVHRHRRRRAFDQRVSRVALWGCASPGYGSGRGGDT